MRKVLEVKNLQVNLKTKYGEVKAVRDVSFDLSEGEVLAIVGESGCGKSVLCRSILKLLPDNGYIKDGQILLNNTNICDFTDKMMTKIRGKEISMIFQDPMTSLNPIIPVGKQIAEAVRIHNNVTRKEAKRRAIELIDFVGIDEAETRYKQYPYEFSGGMRQRIAIAIALACSPKVLIADEPTTALDPIVQNKILDLIKSIQRKTDISVIFITHDMEVVDKIADRVAVMYAGKIVEIGKKDEVFLNAAHPYTIGLMSSLPSLNMDKEWIETIDGMPPNLINPPKGDAFAIRNKNPLEIDFLEEPPMFKISESHYAATWLLHPNAVKAREEIRTKKE